VLGGARGLPHLARLAGARDQPPAGVVPPARGTGCPAPSSRRTARRTASSRASRATST
jgi:hypothetical protein